MSNIVIRYNNIDITSRVIYKTARFAGQMAAQPGMFEFVCKDPNRTDTYVTGKEVTLDVDGVRLFAGYLTMVTRTFAMPVDIVPTDARQWVLRGADYNILFDKRVIRQTTNYTGYIPPLPGARWDGDLIKTLTATYLDIPAGFNTTTNVQNVAVMNPEGGDYSFNTQGTTWRQQMNDFIKLSFGVYYIDAAKILHYMPIEDTEASWGFSDTPNGTTSIGPRDVVATEDASAMINDALVWGGATEFSGLESGGMQGEVVFARHQNAASQSTHGRWQHGEADWGNPTFFDQQAVNNRAHGIVSGLPGSDPAENLIRGLKNPQWTIKATWFGRDVPGNNHLWPGQLVTFNLSTFGTALNPIVLPLRSVDISFPTKPDEVKVADVAFTGTFGIQLSDPWSIWAHMKTLLSRRRSSGTAVAVATDSSTSTSYGGLGQYAPVPAANGTVTTFDLPVGGYISGTLQVYFDGRLLPASGYTVAEVSPSAGTFSITPAPPTNTWLHVVVRTT